MTQPPLIVGSYLSPYVRKVLVLLELKGVPYRVDAQRWPRLAAWIDTVLAELAFVRLAAFEMVAVRTPIAEQRAALLAAGAPLSERSLFRDEPVRGPMSRC